ncbi:hypothetical protein LCGC14_0873880 [marine sediment metagenome]|uniref:ABC transporter domain-containing protein n=1 Tax=marine sediment metagenome TaxID=412755 RepID=A0A0F9RNI8_9ZZZZ|nr:MAG: putative ABC transporter ATP-binding protein [Candidatus Lokiarchaeum sp. GC14_75]HEC39971.1 ATP-binding cassette domain-containing protein [bacterium]
MERGKHINFQKRREKFLKINYKTPLIQILSYLWEYKKLFRIVLTLGIVQSILFLTFPLFLGPALDILVNPSIPIGNILPVFISILIIQSFVGILFGFRIYANRWIGANVIYNLRNDLFSTIQVMSWPWLDENTTGDLMSRTTSDAVEIGSIKGEIEFKNVSFSFDSENGRKVLTNLNFKIKSGENIAILGSTGSGKSILVKLIPRFYDISQGEILIDGINVKDITLKSLRKQIGFVSQERLLFSRSIKDNIAFGNKNITLEEVKSAAFASDIHNFIEKELPEKYNTIVSERGMTVSGGQKQRIAIARALAIKPKILILDDATSSVDVDTEFRIQNNFKEVFKEATTFLITQRLSSIRNADRILVLDKGMIVQLGTHEELMNQSSGIYKKLYLTLNIEEKG